MLQISNLDEGKSEWNINETHIIIPMINATLSKNDKEGDKILANTLTFNSLENGEHTLLSNALENSFVIGFDKNLFDTPNYKSDLVIIQNSDLKLLSCNNDIKNPVSYTVSYVNPNKSETLWQNSETSNDRTGFADKTVLDVRDVITYDESVHDLEKNELQINFSNVTSDITSQIVKTNENIFTRVSDAEAESEEKSSYFVEATNGESTPILQHFETSNSIEDIKLESSEKLFEYKSQTESKFTNEVAEDTQIIPKKIMNCDELKPVHTAESQTFETDEKKKTSVSKCKDIKSGKTISLGVSDSLPEKSLPLKKKAKMKRTLVSFNIENQRSLSVQDAPACKQIIMTSSERKTKHLLTATNILDQNQHRNLMSKTRKQISAKPEKSKNIIFNSLIQDVKNKSKNLVNHSVEENKSTKDDKLHRNKFKNINELVEHLRKSHIISSAVSETLNSGLKEIKIDIFKEMNLKKNKKFLVRSSSYSPQLKAFALVLYFKQPAAFNYLSHVFKAGWPCLKVIKEWKRQINSCQRPNSVSFKANSQNNES